MTGFVMCGTIKDQDFSVGLLAGPNKPYKMAGKNKDDQVAKTILYVYLHAQLG